MGTPRRRLGRSAVMVVAALALSACSSVVAGTAQRGSVDVPSDDTPTVVEPVEPIDLSGPSGPRDGVPRAKLEVVDETDSEHDTLAINTVADLYDFYETVYPEAFPGEEFVPVEQLVSYDSTDPDAEVCDLPVAGEVNAFYIDGCSTIGWDRGGLMPMLAEEVGPLAGPTILAHEVGHRISALRGLTLPKTNVLILEQQADCYAGAYWRWVADGNSSYFDLNQGAGMREVLTAMLFTADPIGSSSEHSSAHGTGFDRSLAFQHGYAEGLARCDEMDQKEVDDRIQQFPFTYIPTTAADSIEITEDFLATVVDTVDEYFGEQLPGYQPPTVVAVTSGELPACGDRPAVTPVDYCPDTDTISYDLEELAEIGTPTEGFDSANGDFSAVIMLVSRVALAGADAAGEEITGPDAGLTALCRTGAWADWMQEPRGERRLQTGPADLNRAVFQVIASPLPASDVSGVESSSVFDQVSALSTGVVHGPDGC